MSTSRLAAVAALAAVLGVGAAQAGAMDSDSLATHAVQKPKMHHHRTHPMTNAKAGAAMTAPPMNKDPMTSHPMSRATGSGNMSSGAMGPDHMSSDHMSSDHMSSDHMSSDAMASGAPH